MTQQDLSSEGAAAGGAPAPISVVAEMHIRGGDLSYPQKVRVDFDEDTILNIGRALAALQVFGANSRSMTEFSFLASATFLDDDEPSWAGDEPGADESSGDDADAEESSHPFSFNLGSTFFEVGPEGLRVRVWEADDDDAELFSDEIEFRKVPGLWEKLVAERDALLSQMGLSAPAERGVDAPMSRVMKTQVLVTVLHRPEEMVPTNLADIHMATDQGNMLGQAQVLRQGLVPEADLEREMAALGNDGSAIGFLQPDHDEDEGGGDGPDGLSGADRMR